MRWSGSLKRVRRDDRRAHVPYGMHVIDLSSTGDGRHRRHSGGRDPSASPSTPSAVEAAPKGCRRGDAALQPDWFSVALVLRRAIAGQPPAGACLGGRLSMLTRADEPWLVMHFQDGTRIVHWIPYTSRMRLTPGVRRIGWAEAVAIHPRVFEVPTGWGPTTRCPPSVALWGQSLRVPPRLPAEIPFAHVCGPLDGRCGFLYLQSDLTCERTTLLVS